MLKKNTENTQDALIIVGEGIDKPDLQGLLNLVNKLIKINTADEYKSFDTIIDIYNQMYNLSYHEIYNKLGTFIGALNTEISDISLKMSTYSDTISYATDEFVYNKIKNIENYCLLFNLEISSCIAKKIKFDDDKFKLENDKLENEIRLLDIIIESVEYYMTDQKNEKFLRHLERITLVNLASLKYNGDMVKKKIVVPRNYDLIEIDIKPYNNLSSIKITPTVVSMFDYDKNKKEFASTITLYDLTYDKLEASKTEYMKTIKKYKIPYIDALNEQIHITKIVMAIRKDISKIILSIFNDVLYDTYDIFKHIREIEIPKIIDINNNTHSQYLLNFFDNNFDIILNGYLGDNTIVPIFRTIVECSQLANNTKQIIKNISKFIDDKFKLCAENFKKLEDAVKCMKLCKSKKHIDAERKISKFKEIYDDLKSKYDPKKATNNNIIDDFFKTKLISEKIIDKISAIIIEINNEITNTNAKMKTYDEKIKKFNDMENVLNLELANKPESEFAKYENDYTQLINDEYDKIEGNLSNDITAHTKKINDILSDIRMTKYDVISNILNILSSHKILINSLAVVDNKTYTTISAEVKKIKNKPKSDYISLVKKKIEEVTQNLTEINELDLKKISTALNNININPVIDEIKKMDEETTSALKKFVDNEVANSNKLDATDYKKKFMTLFTDNKNKYDKSLQEITKFLGNFETENKKISGKKPGSTINAKTEFNHITKLIRDDTDLLKKIQTEHKNGDNINKIHINLVKQQLTDSIKKTTDELTKYVNELTKYVNELDEKTKKANDFVAKKKYIMDELNKIDLNEDNSAMWDNINKNITEIFTEIDSINLMITKKGDLIAMVSKCTTINDLIDDPTQKQSISDITSKQSEVTKKIDEILKILDKIDKKDKLIEHITKFINTKTKNYIEVLNKNITELATFFNKTHNELMKNLSFSKDDYNRIIDDNVKKITTIIDVNYIKNLMAKSKEYLEDEKKNLNKKYDTIKSNYETKVKNVKKSYIEDVTKIKGANENYSKISVITNKASFNQPPDYDVLFTTNEKEFAQKLSDEIAVANNFFTDEITKIEKYGKQAITSIEKKKTGDEQNSTIEYQEKVINFFLDKLGILDKLSTSNTSNTPKT